MRTVGEILSEKRKTLGVSLQDIEKETKIRSKYLEAIEKNDFSKIAESTIVKGFIRNYASALGLSPENLLAVFRRDFLETEKGQILPRGMVEPLNNERFFWTPKATFILITLVLISSFILFFFRQYLKISSAPSLEVLSPKEGQEFNEKVAVYGKADKDASVKIDGIVVSVSEDGQFKEEIVLPRGDNIVSVEAVNRQGKKNTVNIKIKVN